MKVTFPHAGVTWVALKTLFEKYGVECIVPPRSSARTLSLGVKYAPEWICLPYKITLGNLIEGLELGADTILDVGGQGLCRLGYYAKLHERVLRDLGYKFDIFIFDWQQEQVVGLAKFLRRALSTDKSWREIAGDIKFCLQQLILLEDVEHRLHHIRPRELTLGEANKVWRSTPERVGSARTPDALRQVRHELMAELDAIPMNPDVRPLKVAIQGEFFLVMDPFCNMDVAEELGKRGVEVHRSAWITEWAKVWLLLEMVGLSHGRKVKQAANPYLSRDVSGDAVYSLGETILHQKEGFDGVVHIMPFTCMPEIIAQNIFPKVTKDFEIPVLTMILDEQMGKTGILTRLEAFVDLMERRRARTPARSP